MRGSKQAAANRRNTLKSISGQYLDTGCLDKDGGGQGSGKLMA